MITALELFLAMRASYETHAMSELAEKSGLAEFLNATVPPSYRTEEVLGENPVYTFLGTMMLSESHVTRAKSMSLEQALLFVRMLDADQENMPLSSVINYVMVDQLLKATAQAIQADPAFEVLTFTQALAAGYPSWYVRVYLAGGSRQTEAA
jgi:hypothetical protein